MSVVVDAVCVLDVVGVEGLVAVVAVVSEEGVIMFKAFVYQRTALFTVSFSHLHYNII